MLSLTTFIQVGATQFHLLATCSIISLCNTSKPSKSTLIFMKAFIKLPQKLL